MAEDGDDVEVFFFFFACAKRILQFTVGRNFRSNFRQFEIRSHLRKNASSGNKNKRSHGKINVGKCISRTAERINPSRPRDVFYCY